MDDTAHGAVVVPLDRDGHASLIAVMLGSFATSEVGICLCDEADHVRYVNPAFRRGFFADLPETPIDFTNALADAIRMERGIKLESMPLDIFVTRIKHRRQTADPHRHFAVDMFDGSWWWVNDHKLPNGWMLIIASDITTVKDEEFRLRHAHAAAVAAAQTDFLTGLPNRRHRFAEAEARLAACAADNLPVALALIDIDHFKRINDVHGHEVGDRVLVHFATALAEGIGSQDQASRIGGEEFLVLLPGTSLTRAQLRLKPILEALPPVDIGLNHVPVRYTVSAGIAVAHRSETLAHVLHRADVALYGAKTKGRHRIEISQIEPSDPIEHAVAG